MSSITENIRRATQDLDIDFISYSLSDEAIDAFIDSINCVNGIRISRVGNVEELNQQEYKGKRVFIHIEDNYHYVIESKIDFGVHKYMSIPQIKYGFEINFDKEKAELFINTTEQIFVEKLRSLLKFGVFSTRYKDIYDMYYQCRIMDKEKLNRCIKILILDDRKMKESDMVSIIKRIDSIFRDKAYKRKVDKSDKRWLEDNIDIIFETIIEYLRNIN